ncbi:MAG: CehA/McbA family metallohydrolase [Verrucomicrobia bacterium]|nr:CehA/McbA family metallohydrolase [Verrucomicrobiota bacterium]
MNCVKQPLLRLAHSFLLCVTVLILQSTSSAQTFPGGKVLDSKLYHLGDDVVDLWPGISPEPEGERLDIEFKSRKNEKNFTLTLTYWDLNYPAIVKINGNEVQPLDPSQKKKDATVIIPAGTLVNGENTVSFIPKLQDDCVIGNVVLHEKSFKELMKLQTVTLSVLDQGSKQLIPAKVTITDSKGALKQIFLAPNNRTAMRHGLIYIPAAETKIDLVEGDYVFHATRGMEWSLDKQMIRVSSTTNVNLKLRREVDTKGFIASDTHIHTLTFSGHGDSTAEERIITLAGEGVELAIATDHHHHTDFKPFQEKLGMNQYFTSVTGNEVSTKVGHFNTFPMEPNGPVPNKHETNWVKLVEDMRGHGGRVVILNHPRWPRQDVFAINGFNTLTGERASGVPITFDAMELVNSGASQANMQLLEDWFALLNHGEKVSAVGASDSHTVSGIVGQGRTYIRSAAKEPGRIDVDAACDAILSGDTSVSYGIFADVVVNKRFKMGQIVPVKGGNVTVRLRMASPSWVRPERAVVYLNGVAVAERELTPKAGQPFNEYATFSIPAPRHDAYLVCVVSGPGVSEPSWKTKAPYTFAATNPVFLDADRDGQYRSPRDTAKFLLTQTVNNMDAQWDATSKVDDAVAVQMVDLMHIAANAQERDALKNRLKESDRKVFGELLATWSPEVKSLSAK